MTDQLVAAVLGGAFVMVANVVVAHVKKAKEEKYGTNGSALGARVTALEVELTRAREYSRDSAHELRGILDRQGRQLAVLCYAAKIKADDIE